MKRIVLICFLLTGCGCPVDIGDRVVSRDTGKKGYVLSIGTAGGTENCTIAVIHDDGTYSSSMNLKGDGLYDTGNEYVRCWKYKIEDK